MAKVLLAGYNVDRNVLDGVVGDGPDLPPLTPETVSAAYARISRDPRPVTELRRDACDDVARARKSMNTIVFKYGHHSVAEHAAFNFDLLDLSRLAVESIERHRLASYTEKSQRYIRLGKDFVVPDEVRAAGLEDKFQAFVQRCFDRYSTLYDGLLKYGVDPSLAGEDARYALPLATSAQLGMTVNGRTLEYMIRQLAADPLAEARELGAGLLEAGMSIAPSLLLFYEPGPYLTERQGEVAEAVAGLAAGAPGRADAAPAAVRLVHATPDGDARILAVVAQPHLRCSYEEALQRIGALGREALKDIFEVVTRHMTLHDQPPREFEHATITFEVVLSSAAFGQLKRHRMSSQTSMPYDPGLGVTIPPAVAEAGLEADLREAAEDAEEMAGMIGSDLPAAAYALLNAHRRRIVVTMNLRELYHVSRLREDLHAQWDIRAIATEMSRLAREAFPVCAALLGGKHEVDGRLAS